MLCLQNATAQDVSLFHQFSGRYDFIFVGNTLNPLENSYMSYPQILTSSSAELNLSNGDSVYKAYLYWAGCGMGDFEVALNDIPLTAERTFSYERMREGNINQYFSAFVDVTALVQQIGSGLFTLSDLDITDEINYYYIQGGRTNFAGWTLLLVVENPDLPLNQINIYDGLQAVPTEVNIYLDNLNVVDKVGAKIGFIAWEGDSNIANNESLKINGHTLSNALNPPHNAFNGTNTFTNSDTLYNMDLDVYDIQDYVTTESDTVHITLQSDQDLVMINAIVTKLNNQLPDATILIANVEVQCGSREITVNYTIHNSNSTDVLPSNIPISIFANNIFITSTLTTQPIEIGDQTSNQVTFTLPEVIPFDFTLTFNVDANSDGSGIVVELDENNNQASYLVNIPPLPDFNELPILWSCNLRFGSGVFDFAHYGSMVTSNPTFNVAFFSSFTDAELNQHQLQNSSNYTATYSPTKIFVRITDENNCHTITDFELRTRNCAPTVYNYVSANGDGINDTFFIDGLRDIFLNFKLEIYNRWGVLLWTGSQNSAAWDGTTNRNLNSSLAGKTVPDGTYFYVLHLNDPDFEKPLTGYIYFNN